MRHTLLALTVASLLAGCGPSRLTETASTPATTATATTPAAGEIPVTTAEAAAGKAPDATTAVAPATEGVGFDAQVKPILEARCQPCHFPGGKMYEQLPFDSARTIRNLGEQLFTRIKDPGEQALIRAFLAQPAAGDPEDPLSDRCEGPPASAGPL